MPNSNVLCVGCGLQVAGATIQSRSTSSGSHQTLCKTFTVLLTSTCCTAVGSILSLLHPCHQSRRSQSLLNNGKDGGVVRYHQLWQTSIWHNFKYCYQNIRDNAYGISGVILTKLISIHFKRILGTIKLWQTLVWQTKLPKHQRQWMHKGCHLD